MEQPEQTCPEPESIRETRGILEEITELVNRGEIEAISVYAQCRDGSYLNRQSIDVSRHEDAGRILELAMLRLGFLQREHVEGIIEAHENGE